ncbi:MAG: hypothetical protein FWC96_10075, partial [Oscillospiraceae bacterium]|nr:hypothetical protein [Oscillospiraceae bacterium]
MRHRVPKKRLLALMLAAMMVFTLIPAVGAGTVLAAEDGAAFPLVMLESAVGTSVNDWTPRIGTTANPSNPAVEFTRCEERNLLGVTTHTNVPNVHFVQTFTFPRPAVDPLAESGSNGTWFRFSVDVWSDVPPSPDGHGGHNTGFRVTSGVRNSGLTYGHYAAGSSVGGWQTIVTYGMVPATGGATVNMTMELNHSRGSSPSRANSGTTTTYWTNIRIEQLSLDHSIQTTLYAGDFGDTTQGHGQGERYVTVSGMSNEWRILGVVVQHVDVVVPHAVTGLYERRTVSRSEATVNHGRRAFADFAQSLYYMSGGNMRPFAGDRGWDEVLDGPFVPSVDVFVPTEPLRFFEVSDNRLIIAPHQAWDLIYREVARAREAGRPYDQVSFIFPNDGFPGGGIGGLAYGPHNGIRYNLNHMGLNGYTRSGTPTGAAPYGFPHAIVVHEFIHSIEQEGAWRGRAVPAVDGAGGTGGHGYWYHMDMRQNQTSPVVGSESLINMLPTTGPGSVPLQNHGGYANQPGRQVQHRNWGSYLYYLHMMHPDHYVQMGIAPEDRIGAWTTGSGSAQTSVPGGAWPSGSNANNRTQTPPRRGYDVREFTRERFTDTPVMFYALSAAFDMVRPAGYAVGSVTEAGASQNYVWVTEAGMPAAPENGQTLVFGISERNDPNSVRGWQTDPIFARRTHDTNFYIFARAAGNLYYETGAASAAYQVRTGAQGSGNDFVPRFNPQVRLISPTPGRFIPCELTPYGTDADFYITFGFDRAVVPIEGGQIEIPGPALYAWTVAPDGAVSPTRMGGFIQPPMVATLTISADHIEMERGEPILDYYGYPTGEYEYVPVPVTEFTVHITEFANHASIGGIRGFASVRAANGGAAANLRVSAGAFMDMDVRFSDALSQDSAFFYGPIYGFGEDQDPGASRPVDGEYAMVITYDHQMVRVIDGGTYRIGTAFVAGAGMVAIAIPNELRTPFQAGTPLLQSNMINAGVIVRLGDMIPSESLGLIYDLYRLDVVRDVPTSPTQAQLEAGPVVSNYFQGLIREVIWTNGTVLNAKGWMFGGFLGANANIPGLDVTFGRLTSYEDGEFTVGADFRGFPVGTSMDTATQFTLPGNMQVPVYRLENNRGTFGGGGTVNTAHRFAGRYRLSASEINAANQRPAVNAARRIYTIIWHTPTDPTDILSMVFIVDYRPDPDRDYFTEPCDDCGEYPCVCPEFCDDCTEYPCVCPELTGRYAVISYVMGNQVTVGGAAHRIGRAVVTGEGEVNILIPQVMISGGGDNILDNYWMMRGQMIQLGSRANVPGVTRIYSIGGEPAGRAGGGEGLLVSTTYGMLIRHLSFNHGLGVMHRNSPGVGPYRDRGMLNFALWHYRGAIGRSNVVIGRVIDFDPSTGAFAINTTVDPAPVQADIPRSELGTNWDVNSTIFLPIPELAIPVTRELSIPGSNQSAAITVMNPNGIAQSDRILDRFTLNEAEIAAANGVAQMGGPQRVYAVVWLDPADLDNGEPRAVSFIVDTRPSVNYGTTPDLAAPPVFGLRAYNSGRINVPGLGENGLIRVRTTLDGTDAPIPYYGAN